MYYIFVLHAFRILILHLKKVLTIKCRLLTCCHVCGKLPVLCKQGIGVALLLEFWEYSGTNFLI